jgi:hypothetical protein
MTGDDDVAVHSRRGAGYVALSIAFSRLRYSYKAEEDLKHALTEAYGPIAFSSSTDCGAVTLLLCYFDSSRMERPVDNDEVRRMTEGLVTTWEDRVAATLEAAVGEREGRRLFQSYIRSESRSGLYRESTPPEEVPEDIQNLERLEGRMQVGVIPRSAANVTLKLFSPRVLGLTATLRTLQNLGVTVTEELRVPLALPGERRAYLYRFEIETTPERIANLITGEERFVDALRALDEEAATDDGLNCLVLQEGLSWREVELVVVGRRPREINVVLSQGEEAARDAEALVLSKQFADRDAPAGLNIAHVVIAEQDGGCAQAEDARLGLARAGNTRRHERRQRPALAPPAQPFKLRVPTGTAIVALVASIASGAALMAVVEVGRSLVVERAIIVVARRRCGSVAHTVPLSAGLLGIRIRGAQ